MQKVAFQSNVTVMKMEDRLFELAHEALVNFLEDRKDTNLDKIKKLHQDNMVLTEDAKELIVSDCEFLAAMGLGIDTDTCLEVINSIINCRIDGDFVECTRKVVSNLLKENSKLLTLLKGNSIEPARVRQADEDVRDALFIKLNNYIGLLNKMGYCDWKSWTDVPPDNISNMDELSTNAQDHWKRLIALVNLCGRLFQLTPEGDSKMPMHITMVLVTKPIGKYKVYLF